MMLNPPLKAPFPWFGKFGWTPICVAFRGVGTEPAERLAAADRFGAVLYGRRAA